jgi:hypothetical protein
MTTPTSGPTDPLVSVVVPAFNAAKHLRASLDSIVAQTYRNFEVIVVDDASSDETPAIVASYGAAIRSFRQPVNLGTYENANVGIGLARGELIAIYHADDVYDPLIVAREVAFLTAHPEVGAVFCLDLFVDADNRAYGKLELPMDLRGLGTLSYAQVLNGLLRYKNRFLMCPGAMVRAAAYRAVGTYRQVPFGIAADLEMWMRIAQRYPLGILEEHLFRYRHFHGNWTQRYNYLRAVPEEYFAVVDHYLAEGGRELAAPDALDAHEGHRDEDRLFIGASHYIRGDLAQARAVLAHIRARRIVRARTLQRGRLLALLFAFRLLSRLPRLDPVADLVLRRWFVKRPPRPAFAGWRARWG